MRLADSDKDYKTFTENGTRHMEHYLHIVYTFFYATKEVRYATCHITRKRNSVRAGTGWRTLTTDRGG